MKILQVTNFYKPAWDSGGLARSVFELSKSLSNFGHDVTVYTTDGCENAVNLPTNTEVIVDDIPTYYFKNVSRTLARNKITTPYKAPVTIRRDINNFDVVHLHGHRTPLAAVSSYYAFKNDIPLIIKMGGTLEVNRSSTPIKRYLKLVYDSLWGNRLIKNSSHFIARSSPEKEEFIEFGIPKSMIQVIPNAIRSDQPTDQHDMKLTYLRDSYNIDVNDKVILFLGRIHPIKGLDVLIRAFDNIHADMSLKLIIVGPDAGAKSDIVDLVEATGIEDNVVFAGPIYGDDKYAFYELADVFVIPSKYEAFPTTLLEAGLTKTPVLISKNCSISNQFEKTNSVVTFDRTTEALATALVNILDNEQLRETLGTDLHDVVLDNYTWKQNARRVTEVYKDIMDQTTN